MKKENLSQSIVLLGPACVGKSLLSSSLNEKLNLPIVCVDDVLYVVEYFKNGLLRRDEKSQKAFRKACLDELKADPKLNWTLKSKKHKDVAIKQVDDFIAMFNRYYDLFDGFAELIPFLPDYDKADKMTVLEQVFYYNEKALKTIKQILKKLDFPIVLDVPCHTGWNVPESAIPPKVLNRLKNNHIDIAGIQNDTTSILSTAQTVLLMPGQDYDKRNAVSQSPMNNLILSHLENYDVNARVEISTNDLFNNPDHKYFKQRMFMDAGEAVKKEELKNKCEINNICHQIVEMLEDYKEIGL